MSQVVEAIFERGVFKVIGATDLTLSEGQQVRLIVEVGDRNAEKMLDLAGQVYDDLSGEDVNAVEKIAFDRKDFFGDKTP